MVVNQLVPERKTVPLDEVLARVQSPDRRLTPFCDSVLAFSNEVSRALVRDPEARRHPELPSLAFWMRLTELSRLEHEFTALRTTTTLLVPRGMVFHIPPSNVDTTFVYSWMLSMLAGNSNIVRLSTRAGEASRVICRILDEVLSTADPCVRDAIAVVEYGHDDQTTAVISAACDVRVIWGGDSTIADIRRIPIPPQAKELTFADRYSLAAIRASAYLECGEAARRDLAARFYNDTFWFDQMACASPRLVIWVGGANECTEASRRFYELLSDQVDSRQYALAAAPRLHKLTFAYSAILERPVTRYETYGSGVAVLQLEHLRDFDRAHCGGGLLFQACVTSLEEAAPALGRRDQTLTHYGFTGSELRAFVDRANGRAIDRLVPIGQALTFDRHWDGYDLLREFTRTVHVQM
jgi:hypothetical protein